MPEKWIKVQVARPSLCGCGFRVLNDDIEIGTVYHLEVNSAASGRLQCGGCGEIHKVTVIRAGRTLPVPEEFFLPQEVFAMPEG